MAKKTKAAKSFESKETIIPARPAIKRQKTTVSDSFYVVFRHTNKHLPFANQFEVSTDRQSLKEDSQSNSEKRKNSNSSEKTASHNKASVRDANAFQRALAGYTQQLESLASGVPAINSVMPILSGIVLERELVAFSKKKGTLVEETKGDSRSQVFEMLTKDYPAFRRKVTEFEQMKSFGQSLPGISLVGLVSIYDAYLSDLLKAAFNSQHGWVAASEKVITSKQLFESTTIDELKDVIVEKEVQSLIRESHVEQIAWIEKKLAIPLRKDLDCWHEFVEICERRNLFTHSGGVVSRLYLENCKNNGITPKSGLHVGSKLSVNSEYFDRALDVFLEVGVKLGFVIWRKLEKENTEEADKYLSNQGYELIVRQKYKLATRFLEFAITVPKIEPWCRLAMTINLANAELLSGDQEKANAILDREQWSVCGLEFQVCEACIRGDFEKAAKLMLEMGAKGKITREDYHGWPVLEKFRSSEHFKNAYRKLYKSEFMVDEINKEASPTINKAHH